MKQVKSGHWYKATQFESCCDCGLCHQKEYKVIVKNGEATVYFRAWRDKKRTKENRKKKIIIKNLSHYQFEKGMLFGATRMKEVLEQTKHGLSDELVNFSMKQKYTENEGVITFSPPTSPR